jgi:hypothetical protein
MPPEIFISYASPDKGVADDLCQALEAAGLTCWIAPRNIEPSSNWSSSIMQGIAECHVVALILSAHSNESVHVEREVLYAVERGRIIIPVRIEAITPTGSLGYSLVGVQWFNAAQAPFSQHFAPLVAQMRLLLQHAAANSQARSQQLRDIHFQCGRCGQHLVADATGAGESIHCSHCHQAIIIPQSKEHPAGEQRPAAEKSKPTVSEAQLLSPAAVARIESCLTTAIGPIGPVVVRKAMAMTASLAAFRTELLASIPVADDQRTFLHCCGPLLPAAATEGAPLAKLPSAPTPPPASVPASPVFAPAAIADLKVTLATFVGPLAKVLVNRATARATSIPELLDLLATELNSPADRERFLQAVKAGWCQLHRK